MNQGRIWCVVNPTVGLPLFLGSVALTSLAVHGAVLMNTTWYSAFYNGSAAKEKAAMATPGSATAKTAGYSVTVTPSADKGATPAAFTITVTPSLRGTTTLAAPPQPVPVKTASAG